MNYMGNENMNMMTNQNSGGYQPAANNLGYDQQMYIRNHQMPNNNHYNSGCNNMMRPNTNINNMPGNMQSNNMPNNYNMNNMPSNQTISLRPETMTNTDFLPAYLNQFIGKWIRAEFFIGDTVEQRVGVLHEVGASYLIIDAIEPQTLIVCDIYSLKFATIILDEDYGRFVRV